MKWVEATCCVALTGCAAFLLIQGGLLLRDVRKDAAAETRRLDQAITDVDRTAIILGATATNVEKGTRQWQAKQNALADQALSATKALNSDLQALSTLELQGTSLLASQTKSLPSLEATIGASVTDTAQQFASLAKQAQPVMENLSETSKNLSQTVLLANQGISKTLPDIEMTTHDMQGIAKDGREVADHYNQIILHPIHTFWGDFKSGAEWLIMGLEAHAYWP